MLTQKFFIISVPRDKADAVERAFSSKHPKVFAQRHDLVHTSFMFIGTFKNMPGVYHVLQEGLGIRNFAVRNGSEPEWIAWVREREQAPVEYHHKKKE